MRPADRKDIRVAIIDNSINPSVYKPVEHWAAFLRAPFESFRAAEGRLPDLRKKFTHVILTGSEASILEREPWVGAEVEFVREILNREMPILGSCYGHQLLALALRGAAHVRRARRQEIGWWPIEIQAESRLLGKAGTVYAFSSHFDEVTDLDEDFRVLASTPDCAVQAFELIRRPVWGIQFHPEIDIPAAREFLVNLVNLGIKTSPLFGEALGMTARDSGLIRRILRHFLGSHPAGPACRNNRAGPSSPNFA
jgi:GMP synthase-like glutamine amidotransferase